jgi:hypothetical protein
MKQLVLPKKVQVGSKWYSVDVVESMRRKSEVGRVTYGTQKIELARRTHHGIPLKLTALEETFWHELTHAILHDMGEHALNNRENFVEEFAQRLARAIRTARF